MVWYTKQIKKSILETEKKRHFFRMTRRIDSNLTLSFERFCSKIPKDPSHEVYLLFSSKGGDLGEASKIIELRNNLSATVITMSYDIVHSSALMIFASGDLRFAKDPFGKFLFHRAKLEDATVSKEDLENGELSAFTYLSEKTGTPLSYIYELADNNSYLDTTKAKELGLLHKIIN